MELTCKKHTRPCLYVCKYESCKSPDLVCSHQDCLLQHCHDLEMTLIPIEQMMKEIKARETTYQKRMLEAKEKLSKFIGLIKKDFHEIVSEHARQCSILDKIIMQMSELGADGAQAIDHVINLQFDKIQKGVLVKLFKMIESTLGSTSRDDQLGQLQNQLNRKDSKIQDSLKQFRECSSIRRIFTLNLYNSQKCTRHNRFQGQTTSWSFSTGKIDAIQFTVTEDLFLKGYIHFGLIQFPSSPTIKIQIIIYQKATSKQILNIQRQYSKQQCFEKQFQVLFGDPLAANRGIQYEITTSNKSNHFRGRHGNNSKTTSGPFKFDRSRKDTNGTSATGGQYKAFLVYEKL